MKIKNETGNLKIKNCKTIVKKIVQIIVFTAEKIFLDPQINCLFFYPRPTFVCAFFKRACENGLAEADRVRNDKSLEEEISNGAESVLLTSSPHPLVHQTSL